MEAISSYLVRNEAEHEAAIAQLISWEQDNANGQNDGKITLLGEAVDKYEDSAPAYHIDPPQTLAGILEVEMFKRRLTQRALAALLKVTENRLSEIIRGKRAINYDFAQRLYYILQVPADTVLRLQKNGLG